MPLRRALGRAILALIATALLAAGVVGMVALRSYLIDPGTGAPDDPAARGHGGEVRIRSVPGQGTQVTLRLPIEALQRSAAPSSPGPSLATDAELARPSGQSGL